MNYEILQQYTAKLISQINITDLIGRPFHIISRKGENTSWGEGTIVEITSKENGDLYRAKLVNGRSSTGFVNVVDIIILPTNEEELTLWKDMYTKMVSEFDDKISYLKEVEEKEFDNRQYEAWGIMRALKEEKDEKIIRNKIAELLKNKDK